MSESEVEISILHALIALALNGNIVIKSCEKDKQMR